MYINLYKCKSCSNYNFYIHLFIFIYIFLPLYTFFISIGVQFCPCKYTLRKCCVNASTVGRMYR